MRYFDNQKYDEIGIVGVKLQKVILFLMIFHLSSLFLGFGLVTFVGTICMLFLLMIGFKGAARRNPKLLRAYCVGSVVYVVLTLLVALLAVAFFFVYAPQNYYNDDVVPLMTLNPPQVNSNSSDIDTPVSVSNTDPSFPPSSGNNNDQDTPILDVYPVDPSDNSTVVPEPPVYPDVGTVDCNWGFVFFGLALLIGAIVFGMHIASIVMANRMHKFLLATAAQNLAHPKRQQSAEPQVVMPSPMVVQVPVQPNNFGYYPMYTINPTNGQQNGQQQFFYNPYLQPVQYYPQPNPQV